MDVYSTNSRPIEDVEVAVESEIADITYNIQTTTGNYFVGHYELIVSGKVGDQGGPMPIHFFRNTSFILRGSCFEQSEFSAMGETVRNRASLSRILSLVIVVAFGVWIGWIAGYLLLWQNPLFKSSFLFLWSILMVVGGSSSTWLFWKISERTSKGVRSQ